jgi:hypothetical protein
MANGKWKMAKGGAMASSQFPFAIFLLPSLLILASSGCSSNKPPTTRPATASERQDAALKDPFGYSPDMGSNNDISGGGITDYDRKAMRKDIDHVLNP